MSDGRILSGQQYLTKDNITAPFVEQMKDYDRASPATTGDEGTLGKEIVPIDRGAARVRTFDRTTIGTALLAISHSFPNRRDINFPDVLTSLTVVFNKSQGDGLTAFPVSQQTVVAIGSGSVSINPRSTAQGSAAITPALLPDISRTPGQNVPTTVYMFFMADGTVTQAAILTRLTTLAAATVSAWPVFKPQTHTFVLRGQQVSLSANASTQARLSWSENAASGERVWGGGISREVGLNTTIETLPPTIHPALSITGFVSDNETVTVTADASSTDIIATVGAVLGVANIKTISAVVEGSITPTSIAATGGQTSIPITGLYLYSVDVNASEQFGYSRVTCEVFNFAYFA